MDATIYTPTNERSKSISIYIDTDMTDTSQKIYFTEYLTSLNLFIYTLQTNTTTRKLSDNSTTNQTFPVFHMFAVQLASLAPAYTVRLFDHQT